MTEAVAEAQTEAAAALTQAELELLLAALDQVSVRGLEGMRLALSAADKLQAQLDRMQPQHFFAALAAKEKQEQEQEAGALAVPTGKPE